MNNRNRIVEQTHAALQNWNETRRSYFNVTLLRGLGDFFNNRALLFSLLLACVLLGFYHTLTRFFFVPGLDKSMLTAFKITNFAGRFIDIFLTGQALSHGSILALGILPLIPFLIPARIHVLNRGYIKPLLYLLVVFLLFSAALILMHWYRIQAGNPANWPYLKGAILLTLGGLITLNVDAYLYSAARFGVFEFNGFVYFLHVFLTTIDAIWRSTGAELIVSILILLVPVVLVVVGLWRIKIDVAHMGRGWRRAIQGVIRFPMLAPRLMAVLVVTYIVSWGIADITLNAFGLGEIHSEWSAVNLIVLMILLGAMFVAFFDYRQLLHSSNPRQMAQTLDAQVFLVLPSSKVQALPFKKPLHPGSQTEGYLFEVESKRLRYTLFSAIIVVSIWGGIAFLCHIGAVRQLWIAPPITYTIAILLTIKMLWSLGTLLRKQYGCLFVGSSLDYQRSIWDAIRTIINDLEKQGFDITPARELLTRSVDANFLERLKIIRQLYKKIDPTMLGLGEPEVASRTLRARHYTTNILMAALQTVIIAGLVVFIMRLLGIPMDTSSQWGLATSIGTIIFQGAWSRWKQAKSDSPLEPPSHGDRALIHLKKAFALYKGANPNYQQAIIQYRKALDLFNPEQVSDRYQALTSLASCLHEQSTPDWENAILHYHEALELAVHINNPSYQILTLIKLTGCLGNQPEPAWEEACERGEEAFKLALKSKNIRLLETSYRTLQDVLRHLPVPDWDRACSLYCEMIPLFIEKGRHDKHIDLLLEWGRCLTEQPKPNYDKAIKRCRDAIEIIDELKNPSQMVNALCHCAYCLHSKTSPDWNQAMLTSKRALEISLSLQKVENVITITKQLGWLYRNLKEPDDDRAKEVYLQAVNLALGNGSKDQFKRVLKLYEDLMDASPCVQDPSLGTLWLQAAERFEDAHSLIRLIMELDVEMRYVESDKWCRKATEMLDDDKLVGKWGKAYLALRKNKIPEVLSVTNGMDDDSVEIKAHLLRSIALFVNGQQVEAGKSLRLSEDLDLNIKWIRKISKGYFGRYSTELSDEYDKLLSETTEAL